MEVVVTWIRLRGNLEEYHSSQNVVADALSRVTDDVNTNHVISSTNSDISSSIPITNNRI